jgi:hypothetical protein
MEQNSIFLTQLSDYINIGNNIMKKFEILMSKHEDNYSLHYHNED